MANVKKINICIVHYNTPDLTDALIKSIRKYVGNSHIYLFDNSDKAPFKKTYDNLTVFDNTKGQIIDFKKELAKYPNRDKSLGKRSNFGSFKHCISVDKCFDLINKPFILLDSDVLLKKDISDLYDEENIFVGEIEDWSWHLKKGNIVHKRVIPFISFLNVPLCKKNGYRYFDNKHMVGLYNPDFNADSYDTGGWFFEQCKNEKYREIEYNDYVVHFRGASYKNTNDEKANKNEWLNMYSYLYEKEYDYSNMTINICIVHYNTPNLLSALIKSIRKYTPNSHIYIFENSDKYPFTERYDYLTVFDNTHGQIINFKEWLNSFKDKDPLTGKINDWGSAKHCYTIQKCMELIDDGFILLDSDVLLKRDISELCDNDYNAVSDVYQWNGRNRVLPFVCYINVKKCKKDNISFYDEKRIHGLCKTRARNYDTGASFYEDIMKIGGLKKINRDAYIVHFAGGSWNNNRKINASDWLNSYTHLFNYPRPKTVVYTCVTGNYDTLIEPKVVSKDIDYICFTDNVSMTSNVWEVRRIPNEIKNLNLSKIETQRYIKINAHKLLGEYDVSLYVDTNVEILSDVNDFIDKYLNSNFSVYIPMHPDRNCIYDEGNFCIKIKKGVKEKILKQLKDFSAEGFPKNYGLVQANVILRKHNEKECIELMTNWWDTFVNGKTTRDQLSFNYAMWKTGSETVFYLDKKTCHSNYFNWRVNHRTYNSPNNYNLLKNVPKIKMNANPLDMPHMVSRTALFDRANFIQRQNNPNRRVQTNLLIGKHITMPNRSFAKPKKSAFNPLW